MRIRITIGDSLHQSTILFYNRIVCPMPYPKSIFKLLMLILKAKNYLIVNSINVAKLYAGSNSDLMGPNKFKIIAFNINIDPLVNDLGSGIGFILS